MHFSLLSNVNNLQILRILIIIVIISIIIIICIHTVLFSVHPFAKILTIGLRLSKFQMLQYQCLLQFMLHLLYLSSFFSYCVLLSSVIFILFRQWLSNGSNGMLDHSQLVENTWPWAYEALCFSCGYFAYDQWDMLRYHLYNGWIPSILVHHLVLLICFTLALYRNVTINYLILTLICEVCLSYLKYFPLL